MSAAAAAAAAAAAVSFLQPSSSNFVTNQQQLPFRNSRRLISSFSNTSTLCIDPRRDGASAASSALGARTEPAVQTLNLTDSLPEANSGIIVKGPAQAQHLRDSIAEAKSGIIVKRKQCCCIL